MLERALYAFECAWHPAFSPATGNCRLEFAHPPNRAFFTCLFRQTQASASICHLYDFSLLRLTMQRLARSNGTLAVQTNEP